MNQKQVWRVSLSSQTFKLFPELVHVKILNNIKDDEIKLVNDELKKLEYENSGWEDNKHISESSISKQIFKLIPFTNIRKKIKDEFNIYKNDVLKYNDNDFVYTTSWSTRTKPNMSSDYHNHTNCMFSGILYTKTKPNCGDLNFCNFNHKGFNVNPSEYNLENSNTFKLVPQDKMVVFFPSHLYHRITTNKTKSTRYSIAFNFIPVGNVGKGDSALKLKL